MPNYQNGKIYTIRSHLTDEIYIGSTASCLSKNLNNHISECKRWKAGSAAYKSSYKIIEFGDAYIELLENYACADKNELNRRQGELIRTTDNCVNRYITGRTMKQYYQDHKQDLNEKHKQYYKDTKKVTREKNRLWSVANSDKLNQKFDCHCGGKYTHTNKRTHAKTKKHKFYEEIYNFINS
jgi:hypothetical protein